MTRDKDLLLKDLCARLPYGVKYECSDIKNIWKLNAILTKRQDDGVFLDIYNHLDLCKPYLFPISSMTEEQNDSWRDAFMNDLAMSASINYPESEKYLVLSHVKSMQWLYENHFDVNGLIDKGLAIDATGLNIY